MGKNTLRKHFVKDWILYMQCSKCLEIKSEDGFSRCNHWFSWRASCCKECMRKQRIENIEAVRHTLRTYYKNHTDNMIKTNNQRQLDKWYWWIHRKVRSEIIKLWIRPKDCPICWSNLYRIEAHHPDYKKRNEIVFCCKSCHKQIHNWTMECPEPIDLLNNITKCSQRI